MSDHEKYIVFKQSEWDVFAASGGNAKDHPLNRIPDAVVIRRQDSFAPFAFEAYANNIQSVVTVAQEMGMDDPKFAELQKIADYFHEQAQLSYDTFRKLPD